MKHDFWKAFGSYLRQHTVQWVALILFCAIFTGVFMLYELPAEAIWYASLLCMALGVVLFGICFGRAYWKHQRFRRIEQEIAVLTEPLPEPESLLESDYRAIVEELLRIYKQDQTSWQMQRSESIDYYTTWVHQIKTPIAVMRMILQDEDTEEHRELLAELFRVEQYVEMVLCYFRLDSASSDFVFQQYPLDSIIKQTVRKYASQFVRKRIRLRYEATDAVVLTDEKWLGFILEQLLSNAIKYTESGTVTITVDDKNCLSVSDTGIGIAAEDLPRIFDKGFTGYNGRANKKSTGLGLYLCKQAANKLSHSIAVQSQIGKGTTVTLDLQAALLEVE